MTRSRTKIFLSAGLAIFVGLGACSPRIDTRGNLADPDLVLELQPGVHTKADVIGTLGAPSTIGTFQSEAWYYVAEQTKTVAFLETELRDRQVVVVYFTDQGVVRDIKAFGPEAGRDIEPVARETRTAGNEITFFGQLFGNLGKFNKGE